MIAQAFDYSAPKTLAEVLGLLAEGGKPLAGGMSLIPMMKLRLAAPEHLVNIGPLKELNYIREDAGNLHIGATCTHYQVEKSDLVRAKCPLLSHTAGSIGDPQVRNMGTLGGSIAHADPSADYPAALQALEAKLVLASARSERTVSVDAFFLDTFLTALEPGEMIREVIVPTGDTHVNYEKMYQIASGFAVVGVAVRIQKAGDRVSMARIGVTGLSNRAYRAIAAEQALEHTPGSAADVQKAAALVDQNVEANSDLHASTDYRRHMARVYAARSIGAALARNA
jgi:aerobic carbon-monoxide dehydrogenase medium subunit